METLCKIRDLYRAIAEFETRLLLLLPLPQAVVAASTRAKKNKIVLFILIPPSLSFYAPA